LDIIFINENKSVIKIEQAEVQLDVPDYELNLYCSDKPIKWVVEINKGLSEKFDIRNGTNVTIEFS
jgi:uncharacterized membrane protein (UPF0127 family)